MSFQEQIWQFYRRHGRTLPWRQDVTTYSVFVSELMLQQTQVKRVIPKFEQFIATLPDWQSLAKASLSSVLGLWSGLGYNRRGLWLKQSAEIIMTKHGGQLPETFKALEQLPGIGANSAGAIMTYAFNQPVVFIETNIRSVYLYHFFSGQTDISDAQLEPLVEQTLDQNNPREWYWALTDYGAYLKRVRPNPSRASVHHTRQTRFVGSRRELRGRILKRLLAAPVSAGVRAKELNDTRTPSMVDELRAEGFLRLHGQRLEITKL